MKKSIIHIMSVSALLAFASCSSLDLNPKDEASSGNWFQIPEQLEMNLNALLSQHYWAQERGEWASGFSTTEMDMWTDDVTNRQSAQSIWSDKVTSTFTISRHMWDNNYTAINRCNKILYEVAKFKGSMDESRYNVIYGSALMYRACFYGRLLQYFGDVVVMDETMDFDSEAGREEAYNLTRTDKWVVLEKILSDFDAAAEILPVAYSGGEVERATKGAAYGMKARFALHFASIRKFDTFGEGNESEASRLYNVAAAAAKACMDLGVYELYPDFGEFFLQSTKHTTEGILVIPRSKALTNSSTFAYLSGSEVTAKLPRNSGAPTCTTFCPSWDLFCAYYDDQGKPIDESTVYDPHNPFEHRDPRLKYTIVEFGTEHLGVIYDPHFDADSVASTRYGKKILNKDSRSYKIKGTDNQYAPYNGLVFKKGIDDSWLSPFEVESEKRVLRYADVLLMYAEAKIELNQIDESVLDAMNMVRARAYKVNYKDVSSYPAITSGSQAQLRSILRAERRMEFAFECRRLLDIYRWRIAEVCFNQPNLGLPKKDETLQKKYLGDNMWFMGATPDIDENDCPIFTNPVASGEPTFFTNYALTLTKRIFVAPKSYLWPIPQTTLDVMKNVTQNYGY